MAKKSIRKKIANGMTLLGIAGIIISSDLSCGASEEVQKYLVRGEQVAAQRAYELKENYLMGIPISALVIMTGSLLHLYNPRRKKKENNQI